MYTKTIMKRGIIKLNNLELKELHSLVNSSNSDFPGKISSPRETENLLKKLSPVKDLNKETDKTQLFDVFINENESETILDLMPIPSKENNLNLATARTKIQNFLDKRSS